MNDGMKFIYAFDKETCDILAERGYAILKQSADGMITVFENKDTLMFDCMPDCRCVYSNVLTF